MSETAAVDVVAAEAVRLLDVRDFIDGNIESLAAKIEDANLKADASGDERDARFAVLSLATAAMIIEFFSNHKDLAAAETWVREYWGSDTAGRDARAILTALTLLYIVQQSVHRYGDDPARGTIWQQITDRLAAIREQADGGRK
jgi:hypothetical protein